MRTILLTSIVAVVSLGSGYRASARPPTPGSRPAHAPAPPPAQARRAVIRSYRFDALRFGGELSGPYGLLSRGRRARRRGALLSLRRSFVHRIFATIEAPALHR